MIDYLTQNQGNIRISIGNIQISIGNIQISINTIRLSLKVQLKPQLSILALALTRPGEA